MRLGFMSATGHTMILAPVIFLVLFVVILLLLYYDSKPPSKHKSKPPKHVNASLPLPANIPQDTTLTQEEYSKILTWSDEKRLTTLEEITGTKQFSFIGQCILESDPEIIRGYKEYQHNTPSTMYWQNRTNYLLTNKTLDDYVLSENFWLCVFNADPAMGKLLLSLQSEETSSRVYGFLALQLFSPPSQVPKQRYNFVMGKTNQGKSASVMRRFKLRELSQSTSLKSYFQRFLMQFTNK